MPEPSGRAPVQARQRARGLIAFPLAFVFGGAFYMLLIDNTMLPELLAGAAAVLLAATAAEVSRQGGLHGARPRALWPLRFWHVVVRLPGDVFWVSVAALAQVVAPRERRGTLRAVPFRHGDLDDPGDVARRAMSEGLGSVTPNAIVIGIDHERDLILVHQLHRSGGAETIDALRLG
ncbi:MAG: hypothetical protein ACJ780_19400 [Solirubrobacteraceae bacterium]